MLRPTIFLTRTLSVRLSLIVVSAVAILFVATLFSMYWYTKSIVKEEVLQKSSQALEATVQHMDNTLFEVECIARNMRWNVEHHLDHPELMCFYSKKTLELNPDIAGCAIAFEPYYYKERGEHFMAYYYHKTVDGRSGREMVIAESGYFGNTPYTEQEWYKVPVAKDQPYWTDPLTDDDLNGEVIVSYCLPIHDAHKKVVGVLAIDMTLSRLSQIAHEARVSASSYCAILSTDGDYVVHPDSNKLQNRKNVIDLWVKADGDSTVNAMVMDMLAGNEGSARVNLNLYPSDMKVTSTVSDTLPSPIDCYVFYKPFLTRGWRACVVFPVDDMLSSYHYLLRYVWLISVVSIILLLLLTIVITHQYLYPLRKLKDWAKRVADGHLDEPIPDCHRQDEIGQLQEGFQQMQQSLSTHVADLQSLTSSLERRGEVLSRAYEQAKEADRMKTAFLHNMTDQMLAPIETLVSDVAALREKNWQMEPKETARLVSDVLEQGLTVTSLLDHYIEVSEKELHINK